MPKASMSERVERVLDDLAVPLYVAERTTGDGHFVFSMMNRAHRAASGLERCDLRGRRPQEVLPQDSAERLERRLQNCLAQRQAVHFTKRLDCDGQMVHWRGLVQPLSDPAYPDRVLGLGLPVPQASSDRLVQIMLREFALRCTAALLQGATLTRAVADLGKCGTTIEPAVLAQIDRLADRLEMGLLALAQTSHALCRAPADPAPVAG